MIQRLDILFYARGLAPLCSLFNLLVLVHVIFGSLARRNGRTHGGVQQPNNTTAFEVEGRKQLVADGIGIGKSCLQKPREDATLL